MTITTNFLLINKTNLLKAQGSKIQVYRNYTRENNHQDQDQEQGKQAQKSAKLDNH
jgi:Ni2+-binding GTPase involved in maturation of urease and hydrogenase